MLFLSQSSASFKDKCGYSIPRSCVELMNLVYANGPNQSLQRDRKMLAVNIQRNRSID